jgi:thioredoxin reductase
MADVVDAVVVGGGPAGLSAAMSLGRACRSVRVVDAGDPGHFAADAVHNVIGFDGVPPRELRERAWAQLARYDVELIEDRVVGAVRDGAEFVVRLQGAGEPLRARTIVLAGGHRYDVPAVPGLAERFGRTAFHCPFCHGWEVRGTRLAYIGHPGTEAFTTVLGMWSGDVRFVAVEDALDVRDGDDGCVLIETRDEGDLEVDAIFVHPSLAPVDDVPEQLGLVRSEHPMSVVPARIEPTGPMGATTVPGVFVAGDLESLPPSVTSAMASGTRAGGAALHHLSGAGR